MDDVEHSRVAENVCPSSSSQECNDVFMSAQVQTLVTPTKDHCDLKDGSGAVPPEPSRATRLGPSQIGARNEWSANRPVPSH